MRALTVYLSGEKHTYVCMCISPGAVFPGVYARDAEETRIQLEALHLFVRSGAHVHRHDRGYQSGSRLHKYSILSDSRARMTTYVCRSGGPGNKAGGCSDRERAR